MPQNLKSKQLPSLELAVFFDSMAMLMRAGVIANEGPSIIAADMETGHLQNACKKMEELFSSGMVYTISDAMEQSGYFPGYAVEMLRLGETSGRLESTSQLLSRYYRREDVVNDNIRGAIGGPLLLLAMMSVVLFVLILYVLPVFEGVFHSLGALSSGSMQVAFFVSRVALVVVGVLLLCVVVVLVMYLRPGTREKALRLCAVFAPLRRITYSLSAGRFTQGLAMLLASGINSLEALDKIEQLVQTETILKNLPACKKMVEQGTDIGKAMVDSGVLTGFEAKVLLSAARAGQTDIVLDRLAAYYGQEADAQTEAMLGMIEPALVGILSVAIGVILLSVMLPLTGIMGAIH